MTSVTAFDPFGLVGPFLFPVLLFAGGLVLYGLLYLVGQWRED